MFKSPDPFTPTIEACITPKDKSYNEEPERFFNIEGTFTEHNNFAPAWMHCDTVHPSTSPSKPHRQVTLTGDRYLETLKEYRERATRTKDNWMPEWDRIPGRSLARRVLMQVQYHLDITMATIETSIARTRVLRRCGRLQ